MVFGRAGEIRGVRRRRARCRMPRYAPDARKFSDRNRHENPAQLGHDRIAGAVGAAIFFEPPYISVDMGTAVTVDLVDSCGRYAGGAVAPGMHAFASYLAERAAQLPNINPAEADFDLVIGRDTVEAMYVGCAQGFLQARRRDNIRH